MKNTRREEHPDAEIIFTLLPFGGGTWTFKALYNADTRKLLKFDYGAPL